MAPRSGRSTTSSLLHAPADLRLRDGIEWRPHRYGHAAVDVGDASARGADGRRAVAHLQLAASAHVFVGAGAVDQRNEGERAEHDERAAKPSPATLARVRRRQTAAALAIAGASRIRVDERATN